MISMGGHTWAAGSRWTASRDQCPRWWPDWEIRWSRSCRRSSYRSTQTLWTPSTTSASTYPCRFRIWKRLRLMLERSFGLNWLTCLPKVWWERSVQRSRPSWRRERPEMEFASWNYRLDPMLSTVPRWCPAVSPPRLSRRNRSRIVSIGRCQTRPPAERGPSCSFRAWSWQNLGLGLDLGINCRTTGSPRCNWGGGGSKHQCREITTPSWT